MSELAVLDTNVLLDFLDAARPEHRAADEAVALLLGRGAEIGVPATSLKDVYYLLTRRTGEASARGAVKSLMSSTRLLAVDHAICQQAAAGPEPDFEDGLIMACAERAGAAWIVTRDKAAFHSGPVAKIDPVGLIETLRAADED
ncbi:MAG: PIN domain-containing protein [Bifidobacteriaceae bacterium]|jgi:predicted nucleic acid-binding protein|nr:PIN domain-containing protein [Bifidobacteriaceae bacterium]